MKVVLFCGGLGTRLREHSETVPKPLVEVGPRPIVWHLMRYYAHFGHKEFILCLGYKGDLIKDYFLNYNQYKSRDIRISEGGRKIESLSDELDDWKITLVETGLKSNLGQRLAAVKPYVEDDEVFLANYSDGLSDLPLDSYLAKFQASQAVASFVSVRPFSTYHLVESGADEQVTSIVSVRESDIWVNGGFFALRREIIDYIKAGEELVEEPFQRLIAERRLMTTRYDGFWIAMDTFKDWKILEDLYHGGERPWDLGRSGQPGPTGG